MNHLSWFLMNQNVLKYINKHYGLMILMYGVLHKD